MRNDSRIILAIDETDVQKAIHVVNEVCDIVDAIKINWPLILSAGPEIITTLSEKTNVICDFKIADIPNTDRLIVEQSVKRGASGVIVHAFTGTDSLKECVCAAKGNDVFVVTEMSHPGGKEFTAQHSEKFASMAVECGASGIIAPATRPERIKKIREVAGDLLILSPGVGAQGGSATDAIVNGADYIIVGRSIYNSPTPKKVAMGLCDEIHALGL